MDAAVPAGNTDASDWVSDISLADVVVELEIEDEHDFFLGCGGRRAPLVLLCMVAISFKGL